MEVIKTLKPGAPGTQRLQRRFGDRLVAVRYRRHPASGRMQTTVELIIEERRARIDLDNHDPLFPIKIGWDEKALQQQVKRAGGRWDSERKAWWLVASQVEALKLMDRLDRPDKKV
ncbi:MAG: hypothetical protein EP312_03920 [Gammaproteobacteria bacterium]|nr:MAG: hypothetical protein EP312_03920 [Gammaproteobacteria bacterium]